MLYALLLTFSFSMKNWVGLSWLAVDLLNLIYFIFWAYFEMSSRLYKVQSFYLVALPILQLGIALHHTIYVHLTIIAIIEVINIDLCSYQLNFLSDNLVNGPYKHLSN